MNTKIGFSFDIGNGQIELDAKICHEGAQIGITTLRDDNVCTIDKIHLDEIKQLYHHIGQILEVADLNNA